jgi:hypothetical protein
MKARIYKPAKTAMQSGMARTHLWRLEFDAAGTRFIEPLMGWTGTTTTRDQSILRFESKEAAIAYALKHGIEFEVEEPHQRILNRRAYADNFSYTRIR